MRTIISASLLCLLASFAAIAAEPVMQDGMWEITTKIEMPGLTMQPLTTKQCISKKDVEDGLKSLPQSPGKNDKCSVKDYKLIDNKATWAMQCQGKDAVNGTGEITYRGNSYEGRTQLSMKHPQQGEMKMTQLFSAKRIGDCK